MKCLTADCHGTPAPNSTWCKACGDHITDLNMLVQDIFLTCVNPEQDYSLVRFVIECSQALQELVGAIPCPLMDPTIKPYVLSETERLSLSERLYILGQLVYKSGLMDTATGEDMRPGPRKVL